ncbi:hypothetical protein Q0P45_13980, partial [Staphylococcus aureus]|nr:hypothetical protein [Staphylococcus aureus]
LLPDLLKKQWGKEIFETLSNDHQLTVKGAAGSSYSILAAEYFLTTQKTLLLIVDDKEDALYVTAEMEELCGKENVLYFPATYLEP